jgi:hypothetical protein
MRTSLGIRKPLAALAVLGLVLLFSGIESMASTATHTVILNAPYGDWTVSGKIVFTVAEWGGTISVGGSTITLNEGDKVEIDISGASTGKVWFGNDGWVYIESLPIEALYVNGELNASNTQITSANINYDVGSVESTLKVEVEMSSAAWTKLNVDGQDVINGEYKGYIIVYNIAPTSSVSLNLDIDGKYLESGAEGVEWNGNVIGVPEYPFIGMVSRLFH